METSGATPAPPPQHQMTNNGMDAILAGFASIQQALGEFRVEAARNQTELEELRARFEEVLTTSDSGQPPRHSAAQPLSQPLPTPTPLSTLTYTTDAAVKLYPLPQFDGKPEEWPLFYANFRDSTIELGYDNKRNLMRLHKALVGEARRTVASLLIYPDDVPKAIDELKFNFGRPELLVRSQLEKIRQFPMIGESRLEQVLTFANQLRNVVALFKSADCRHQLANFGLLEQLVLKLPPSKQFEWSRYAADIVPYATVEHLTEWVADLARVVSLMPPASQARASNSANRQLVPAVPGRRVLHTQEPAARVCFYCSREHLLAECRQFAAASSKEKWDVLKRHSLCFSCLKKGHNLARCRKRQVCGVDDCQRLHHHILHDDVNARKPPPSVHAEEPAPIFSCRQPEKPSYLFKICPVELSGPAGKLKAYAMLDEGSSVSLLQEDAANALGLRGQRAPLTLQWFGNKTTTEKAKKAVVTIVAENGECDIRVRTVANLDLPTQTFYKRDHPHLSSLPIADYIEAKPVLLLGLDNSFLGTPARVVEVSGDQPIAIFTKLGWVAYGPMDVNAELQPRVLHVREAESLKSLNKMVEEYFNVENFGVRSTEIELRSDDDIRASAILAKTTKHLGPQYEVGLLWKQDQPELPRSYAMAAQRLQNVESRMLKDPWYAAKYEGEMDNYLKKGYARKLTPQEAATENPTTWYLPHFGVMNPNKPTKLRIVFDAAAAVANVSLNSSLLKGPEKAQSLITVLFRFRLGRIAVVADIQEMFSQVKIRPPDQQSQRFLWRHGDKSKPIEVYAMTSMMFGAVCSPCCAEYVKNKNAAKYQTSMPLGSKAVIENMYVDDLVISFTNEDDAEDICRQAVKINAAAGFKLRGFVSNNKMLQTRLSDEEPEQTDVLKMERQNEIDKVLGMFWNTTADTFEFHFRFHRVPKDVLGCVRPPTKREILGIVMSIYDPFGILANLTVSAKLLLQSVWKAQIAWNQALPDCLCQRWWSWWEEFQEVKHLTVRRCFSPLLPEADEVQLHVFVDASAVAYAAVAYLRVQKREVVDISFVAAKTRCAPPKDMSIPRMELQAAILGCRLKQSINECLPGCIHRTIFWSDSKTVLLWIRSTERKYKPFVAHRIAEILSCSNPTEWRWLPSVLNNADDATRAKMPPLELKSRWTEGPEFLRKSADLWPKEGQPILQSEDASHEEIPLKMLLMRETGEHVLKYTKFSSYPKMLRVVAWVRRFIGNLRGGPMRSQNEVSAEEVNEAEKLICRQVQGEAFAVERELLQHDKPVPKSSAIYALTPYLDEEKLLRVRGRIDAAYCLPFAARRPIILPKNHHVSRLICRYYHQKRRHQNDKLVINEMRQKFWVVRARALLDAVRERECSTCAHARAKPVVPLMGQLPSDRLTPFVRPFTYAGVDYCGPFFVAVGRRSEKRWIALFTCLTTRAVHLEVAEDLSTSAFLLCLRNFMNRRGTPVRIRSDNGTNFVGAQKELTKENRLFDMKELSRYMATERIEWVFNCPANPSSGGCWERLVQCVKRLLSASLKEVAPRLEVFRTVIIEAENIVNSRPLTDLPLSPEDEDPLTPNHFLLGCLNSTQTPAPPEMKVCPRKQWRVAQNLKDRLWKRWTVEYLPQLLQRPKWRDVSTPLQPGEVVIICDPAQPRSQWEKARVTRVFPDREGQVRVVEVKTSHCLLRRPASKLAALQIGESPLNSRGVECGSD